VDSRGEKADIRTIGEQSPADSRKIIEKLSGAIEIYAIDVDVEPDLGETTNDLIITLPSDLAKRAELFAFQARLAQTHGKKTAIMYIEYKGDSIVGPARIGRVTFSKTGQSDGRRHSVHGTS
jgi:hypothetical protein